MDTQDRSPGSSVLRRPFQEATWRNAASALLSAVSLSPLIIASSVNASVKAPAVTLAGIVLYVALFLFLREARFERWRTTVFRHRHERTAVAKRRGGSALYLMANIAIGSLGIGVVLAWIAISVRNILFYPIFGWAPYPDPAWGGPTPAGAVLLHLVAGLIVLFAGPWVIGLVADVQAWLVATLLAAPSESRVSRTPGEQRR